MPEERVACAGPLTWLGPTCEEAVRDGEADEDTARLDDDTAMDELILVGEPTAVAIEEALDAELARIDDDAALDGVDEVKVKPIGAAIPVGC